MYNSLLGRDVNVSYRLRNEVYGFISCGLSCLLTVNEMCWLHACCFCSLYAVKGKSPYEAKQGGWQPASQASRPPLSRTTLRSRSLPCLPPTHPSAALCLWKVVFSTAFVRWITAVLAYRLPDVIVEVIYEVTRRPNNNTNSRLLFLASD